MISSPPQVPSGTLGVASSTRNYLHIITTSLRVCSPVILHPNPPTCYLSAVISFSSTFLFYHSPAGSFPGNDMTPSLWSVDLFMFAVSIICPFSLLAPSALCPLLTHAQYYMRLYDLPMFFPTLLHCQNAPLASFQT